MHPPDLRIKSENFHQRPQRIMWHIVATRPLTCLSTIWSNSKGAFWTCCVIPNRWICPRKRQKLYNKRLYVTSSMENWGNDTVRDHCHVTGKFRGAAHSSSNLNYRLHERIPVFFQNLKGYDAHHIMNAFGKFKHKKINCFPQNHEKHISFSLGRLDFVDTFQFMSTALDTSRRGYSEISSSQRLRRIHPSRKPADQAPTSQ